MTEQPTTIHGIIQNAIRLLQYIDEHLDDTPDGLESARWGIEEVMRSMQSLVPLLTNKSGNIIIQ